MWYPLNTKTGGFGRNQDFAGDFLAVRPYKASVRKSSRRLRFYFFFLVLPFVCWSLVGLKFFRSLKFYKSKDTTPQFWATDCHHIVLSLQANRFSGCQRGFILCSIKRKISKSDVFKYVKKRNSDNPE